MRPTIDQVREVSGLLRSSKVRYGQALGLRDQVFSQKFRLLPQNLQEEYARVLHKHASLNSANTGNIGEPELKQYYRRAVRMFHPDSSGTERTSAYFREATEAYTRKDLEGLQLLVLPEMAANFDILAERDREFLLDRYADMCKVDQKIDDEGTKLVRDTLALDVMSDQMFTLEIEESIKRMKQSLVENDVLIEGQSEVPRLERGR